MQIVTDIVNFRVLYRGGGTSGSLKIIERAGRTSYRSYKGKRITEESAIRFIKRLVEREHDSVLEHSILTVVIKYSIGATRESNRHRISSPTEMSTRYVNIGKGRGLIFVYPPHRTQNITVKLSRGAVLKEITPKQMIKLIEDFYKGLITQFGWTPEDARQFLPLGTQSEVVISANFREWRRIFELRTEKAAHWEIRSTMCAILEKIKPLLPGVFDDFVLAGKDKYGYPYYKKLRPANTVINDLINIRSALTQEQIQKLLMVLAENDVAET